MLTKTYPPLQPCQQDVHVFAVAGRQSAPKPLGEQRHVRPYEQKRENDWGAYCVKQQLI